MADTNTARDADRIEASEPPPTPVIGGTVRRLREQEMRRPATSLARSGVAAVLPISFWLLAQALQHRRQGVVRNALARPGDEGL